MESYTIDVDSPDFLACVPGFRKGCGLTGTVVHRHDWQRELSPLQAALAEGIDDRRSIAEIAEAVASSGAFARSDIAEVRTVAVETFRSLWQQDFLAMGIRPVGL